MGEDDILEGFLALIAFSIFFLFATIGIILTSTNPDSYLYIEYNPPEDFFILLSLLLIDLVFLALFLNKSLKFRISHNLNKRQLELLLILDKMKFYSVLCVPLYGFLIYFYVKYFETSIAIYLFLTLLFEISLIILIFYNSFIISRDNEKD
jgi:hypothetical protein